MEGKLLSDDDKMDEMQRVGIRVLCQSAALKSRLFDYGASEFQEINQDRTLF